MTAVIYITSTPSTLIVAPAPVVATTEVDAGTVTQTPSPVVITVGSTSVRPWDSSSKLEPSNVVSTSIDPAQLYSSPISSPTVTTSSYTATPFVPSPHSTNSPTTRSLSLGARAGIGVAISIVKIVLATVAFMLFRRSRRRPKATLDVKTTSAGVATVEDTSKSNSQVGAVGVWSRAEMDADDTVKQREREAEDGLASEETRSELE